MSAVNTGDVAVGASTFSSVWISRGRFVLAVALVWSGLHLVVDRTVLMPGLDRPVVVVASESGLSGALVVAVVLWVGAYVGALLAGVRDGSRVLLMVGLALALWATGGGTMDDWLLLNNQLAQGPRAAPYWALLGEYLYLGVVIVGVIALGNIAALGRRALDPEARRLRLRRIIAVGGDSPPWRDGVFALLVTTLAGALLLFLLSGPREAHTWRGQVYFAVGVGFILAVLAAQRVTRVRHLIWYCPAPFIVGLIGAVRASLSPGLPPPFDHLDMIPPWALVRPLPVEMVGVGLLAITWTLRTTGHLSGRGDAG